VRAAVRAFLWETAKISARRSDKLPEGQGQAYRGYFNFSEPIRTIPPHRILAINRGEKENALAVKVEWDPAGGRRRGLENLPRGGPPHAAFREGVTQDPLDGLLLPSRENEIRRELKNVAEEHAVGVFAHNLRALLLQPPLRGRRVLAIDPGLKSGCKVACLDETGNLLEEVVIYPHQAPTRKDDAAARRAEAEAKLEELIRKHDVKVIALR